MSGAIDYLTGRIHKQRLSPLTYPLSEFERRKCDQLPRDRVKSEHDLLLPVTSLQWVCYKPQFQCQKCKDAPCTPAAPRVQSATNVAFSSFTANWTSVSGATDYRLDVATDSSFINYVSGYQNLSVGNMTNFPVTGLSAHTTYYYRVRAYNGCATSLNSSAKSVQTLPCTPAAPSAQSATNVTASSFTANWRSVSGAIDYRLDVATDSALSPITYPVIRI